MTKRRTRLIGRSVRSWLLLLLIALIAAACGPAAAPTVPTAPAIGDRKPTATALGGLLSVSVNRLPREARDTLTLIEKGGPFPNSQDGVVFENREGLLPKQPQGYYHEYTVVTPGSSDRGARRIITGSRGEIYYTDDHYATLYRVIR